ncbi:MAG: SIS domain-containing protein [Patescibacteria group bacterium]|nr:SIS domain-containing protein [Patescibacteria group bacterium]
MSSQNILDNLAEIKKLDTKNMLGSLEAFAKQAEEIWKSGVKLKLPANYKTVKNIAVFGMGGSALGTHAIKVLFFNYLKIPLEIINDYRLPAFVDNNTLVIASSYSGNTEEVISAFNEAREKKAKIAVISAGGKLAAMAEKYKIPAFIFTTDNNPCGSPRMGLCYSIFGQMIILAKAGVLKFGAKELKSAEEIIKKYVKLFGAGSATPDNQAKTTAVKSFGKSVWFVGSEHLSGNIHIASNQMNENAKRFSGYFVLPELNHHLLEGLANPRTNGSDIIFIFIESGLYDKRTRKRYKITKQVLDKNNIEHISYSCREKTSLAQVCEVLAFSGYLSFYSAVHDGIDPTAIPFVDYLKRELANKK